jgi:hypothetical protein
MHHYYELSAESVQFSSKRLLEHHCFQVVLYLGLRRELEIEIQNTRAFLLAPLRFFLHSTLHHLGLFFLPDF